MRDSHLWEMFGYGMLVGAAIATLILVFSKADCGGSWFSERSATIVVDNMFGNR